ncbi:MAG: RseA family anti-sigma factor [Halieaceae bacterium]|nr:RseA family anti-sigma factor [Halieaceae bacterium]
MSASNREVLSALLDDEARELELRRLLRELDRDDDQSRQLQGEWYRQHLIRAALQGDQPRHAPDFSLRVAEAVAAEAMAEEPAAAGWRRALGSMAVAASVAAVVVLGGQQLSDGVDDAVRVAPLPSGVVNTLGAVPVQASFGTRAVPTLEPADRTAYRELARQRLRRYSQEHAEHASLNTPQGLVPFARVPVIER